MSSFEEYNNLKYNKDFTICWGFSDKDCKTPKFHPNTRNIGIGAFKHTKIETLDLSNTKIECIGISAFMTCINLKEIIFPETLININGNAFANCSSLNKVNLSNTKVSIVCRESFSCSGITEIILPPSLSAIKEYAFAGCDNLSTLNLPNNVSSIDISMIENTNIKVLNLPANIKYIRTDYMKFVTNELDILKKIVYTKLPESELEKLKHISEVLELEITKADLDCLIKEGKTFKEINNFFKEDLDR